MRELTEVNIPGLGIDPSADRDAVIRKLILKLRWMGYYGHGGDPLQMMRDGARKTIPFVLPDNAAHRAAHIGVARH